MRTLRPVSLNDLPSKGQNRDSTWDWAPKTELSASLSVTSWAEGWRLYPRIELFTFENMLWAKNISIFNNLMDV